MKCINCGHRVEWLVKPMCKPIHHYNRPFTKDGHRFKTGALSKECLVKGCKCRLPMDELSASICGKCGKQRQKEDAKIYYLRCEAVCRGCFEKARKKEG